MCTALQLERLGKPVPTVEATASPAAESLGRKSRLFVRDRETGCQFLVDTGADVSIIPFTRARREVTAIQKNFDLSTVNKTSKYFELLNLYPDLKKPNLINRLVKQKVEHHILTTGQPVYSRARHLAPDKLKLSKQEFQFMLDNDLIRRPKSQWASPLHLVNNKDGTLRPCGDYRRLNAQIVPDRCQIPRIEDFHCILKDIFSKIDLVKAYYQIPITEEDKAKTAKTTPFGHYEFNVMSFVLCNAPSTFQRFITEVLFGLDFAFPYLDDVLVASSSEEEHKEHLKMVLDRFQQYGL
ncbi:Transposon Ty3-I Gag-Pol polyprotein [Araneus ventricosus]|uniref:Transposon Ty3-I Gag-Pol polyprotein n=1 Tax=Araneus ventricosus TaxID=182803 RepID=A0A4Y2PFW4_ARAVE|nr:Transposon Ty3-I Gag-Pol polyprotein [Araneus ventricosus]